MGSATKKPRLISAGPLYFNPVVSFLAFFILWGVAIYCMVEPEEAGKLFGNWQTWVTACFNWFYMLTQNIWIIFGFYVYFKWGNVKLCAPGKDHEKPEYDDFTYFVMIYTCGVAVGMFFYGVAEPVWHYLGGNRYTDGSLNDVEKAQWAMSQTIFHWGLHGWVPYQLMGCCLGLIAYRKNLPMTIRTTMEPIMGTGIYGWVGDFIDAFSMITVVMGICTSLGLGVNQLLAGMLRLDENLYNKCGAGETGACEDSTKAAVAITILLITLVATVSVVSGLNYGIKFVSRLGFALGMFLMFTVMFMENTWGILNIFVQSIGHYLWVLPDLSFTTDGWAEIAIGDKDGYEGHPIHGAPDGKSATIMNSWTIFYWGWWISWGPFVGTFIARISKGRTIREVVNYSMMAPLTYIILWFSVFGTAGISMLWTATNLKKMGAESIVDKASGVTCYLYPNATNTSDVANYAMWNHKNIGGWSNMACELGNAGSADMWFLNLKQYYGFETFLTVVSLAALITYFIASSDSGSLVVDLIASNGKTDASTIQRVIWAFTEGGVAIGLMVAGGGTGTGALQAMSICCGLPFTVLLCLMCTSMYRVLVEIDSPLDIKVSATFPFALWEGVFDTIECALSLGETAFPGANVWVSFAIGCVFPVKSMYDAQKKMGDSTGSVLFSVGFATFSFFCWFICLVYGYAETSSGMWSVGWAFYWCYAFMFAETRYRARAFWGITNGNFAEDLCAAAFLYPQAAAQLEALAQTNPAKKDTDYQVPAQYVQKELEKTTYSK